MQTVKTTVCKMNQGELYYQVQQLKKLKVHINLW